MRKPYAALLGKVQIAIGHRLLDFAGATNRVDDAGEFRQHAVAGGLDDPAVMLADLRFDHFSEMRLQAPVGPLLVSPHQPRIARHIGGEDRGKAARRAHSSGNRALRSPSKRIARAPGEQNFSHGLLKPLMVVNPGTNSDRRLIQSRASSRRPR
jgi:hypothetical protein